MSQVWRDDAACQDIGTDLFFPDHSDILTANAAKSICRRCPVAEPCATFAIESGTRHGIWGGLGVNARDALGQMRRAEQGQAELEEVSS